MTGKHAKPDYQPPRIDEIGTADEQALAAIRQAFDNLNAAGIRPTITRLLEEVRRLDQKTPNAVLAAAVSRFDKAQGRVN